MLSDSAAASIEKGETIQIGNDRGRPRIDLVKILRLRFPAGSKLTDK